MQDRIDKLEVKYGFKFCEDYREFLVILSEGQFDASGPKGGHYINVDDLLVAWPGVSVPGPAMDEEAAIVHTGQDLLEKHGLYRHISNLYCLGRLEADFEEGEEADGDIGNWNLKLLIHAYPVGQTYSGDPIVQVTQGKHAGKIFFTNHESWHGHFEHLASTNADERAELEEEAEDAMEALGLESLESLSTDQLIDFMMHESLDGNSWLADSYRDFYCGLCLYRGAR